MEISTFLFYFALMIVVTASYRIKWESYNWIAITLLTLVLGLRGCGIDTPKYIEAFHFYQSINEGLFNPQYYDPYFNTMMEWDLHTEWFYLILYKFIKLFSKSSVWYFLIVDFISIIALDKFIQRYIKREKILIIFFFFTTLIFVQMFNVTRQFLAFMIFLNVLGYIEERKWKHYIIGVLFISIFLHNSAIIMLPFYFFIHHDFLKNRVLQFAIYLFVLVFTNVFIDQLQAIMNALYLVLGGKDIAMASYLNSDTLALEMKSSLMGRMFHLITVGYLILHSVEFKKSYGKLGIAMYNLTYLGMLIIPLAFNRGVERMNNYFYSFIFILLGLMTYQSFWGYNKKNIVIKAYTYLIFIMYIAWFANCVLQGAAGCAPYELNPEL